MKKVLLTIATAFMALSLNAQIENFDGVSTGSFTYQGGDASAFNTAATPPEGSSSAKCGYSKRFPNDAYDNIQYTLTNNLSSEDVAGLKNGTKKLKMNLATNADAGIRVLIKLNATGTTEYNSEYDVRTTKGGSSFQWEELTFAPNVNIGSLANGSVNVLTIFFAIEGFGSSNEFFFDDLRIETVSSIENDNNTFINAMTPNPANGLVTLNMPVVGTAKATLIDATGKVVAFFDNKVMSGMYKGQLDVSQLNEGIYFVSLVVDGKNVKVQPLIVNK